MRVKVGVFPIDIQFERVDVYENGCECVFTGAAI